MIYIVLGFSSLNVYTEVGLVTLMGLISKHGILIVRFARQSRLAGKGKRETIEEAASVRLRPILMTKAAMVSIGTLFTLVVVPAMYLLLSSEHRAQRVEADASAGASPNAAT